jgi:hypothetical protein
MQLIAAKTSCTLVNCIVTGSFRSSRFDVAEVGAVDATEVDTGDVADLDAIDSMGKREAGMRGVWGPFSGVPG